MRDGPVKYAGSAEVEVVNPTESGGVYELGDRKAIIDVGGSRPRYSGGEASVAIYDRARKSAEFSFFDLPSGE